MKKTILTGCLLAGLMAGAADSHAVVLNFESLLHNDDQIADHSAVYTESGFRFVNTATEEISGYAPMFSTLGSEFYGFSGSTALFNNNFMGETVLSRVDSGLFNLHSISLAELYPIEEIYDTVTFTGAKANGSTVSQMFTLDSLYGAEDFSFSNEFKDLVAVSWLQSDYFHQFDNIDVAPVPEPSTLLLLGAGLIGVIAGRKKLGKVNMNNAAA